MWVNLWISLFTLTCLCILSPAQTKAVKEQLARCAKNLGLMGIKAIEGHWNRKVMTLSGICKTLIFLCLGLEKVFSKCAVTLWWYMCVYNAIVHVNACGHVCICAKKDEQMWTVLLCLNVFVKNKSNVVCPLWSWCQWKLSYNHLQYI